MESWKYLHDGMLSMCRVKNTYLMLKRDHGDKRFTFIFFTSQKIKKKKSQTGISELVKATGNVRATDASAHAELERFSKKKGTLNVEIFACRNFHDFENKCFFILFLFSRFFDTGLF